MYLDPRTNVHLRMLIEVLENDIQHSKKKYCDRK